MHRGAFARYQTYSLWGQHSLRYDAVWRNTVPSADSASFKVREEAGHTLKSALSHTVEVDMKDFSGDFGGVLKIENELAGMSPGGLSPFLSSTVVLDCLGRARSTTGPTCECPSTPHTTVAAVAAAATCNVRAVAVLVGARRSFPALPPRGCFPILHCAAMVLIMVFI